jgi:NAD(P)-dependent dehydrogenase (short-subunit alcohol dehydrogenase family)
LEAELAWGAGACFAAWLRRCGTPTVRESNAPLAIGVYAITGGLGGLGLRATALLVGRGVSRVVLTSRSGRVVRDGQGLEVQLRALGARASVAACDSADPRDTGALVGHCQAVAGVLHAAGAAPRGCWPTSLLAECNG